MSSFEEKKTDFHKGYVKLGYLWFGLIIVFYIVSILAEKKYFVLQVKPFLYIHILLEFFSIIISFIIFTITYYSYKKNNRSRLLVYASTFFIVGFVDFFHTMSYEGMPGFWGESSIPLATYYWIIGRIIFAIGVLLVSLIPVNKLSTRNRESVLLGSIILTANIFYWVNYHVDKFPPIFIEGQGLTPLKIGLEYIIMIVLGIAIFFYLKEYNKDKNIIFLKIAIGLSFGIFSEAAFTLYNNVHDSYNVLGHIYKVFSRYFVFRAVFIYNLDIPYIKLQQAREEIIRHAENLEKLVNQRTHKLEAANRKILNDLEYAKRIQQSLLPPKEFKIHDVKFTCAFIPCQRVSGDFFYIHEIDNENIHVFIADVAGHGPSAAMVTIFTERVIALQNIQGRGGKNLDCRKVLLHLYKEFNKSNFPDEMHIGVLNGIYNKNSKILSYSSAGFNTNPILIRGTGKIEILDKSRGFPICKLGNIYKPEFQEVQVQLEKGDRIIFYTDGLVENFKNNTLLTMDALENILSEYRGVAAGEVKDKIKNKIKDIIGEKNIDDDITFFIMDV